VTAGTPQAHVQVLGLSVSISGTTNVFCNDDYVAGGINSCLEYMGLTLDCVINSNANNSAVSATAYHACLDGVWNTRGTAVIVRDFETLSGTSRSVNQVMTCPRNVKIDP